MQGPAPPWIPMAPRAAVVAPGAAVVAPLTRARRPPHAVDVDLGQPGGVVVDDDLDCRNVQTSGMQEGEKKNKPTQMLKNSFNIIGL